MPTSKTTSSVNARNNTLEAKPEWITDSAGLDIVRTTKRHRPLSPHLFKKNTGKPHNEHTHPHQHGLPYNGIMPYSEKDEESS